MADEPVDQLEFPGSITLDELLNALTVQEVDSVEKLIKLEILPDGPDGHRILASLADRPIGVPFKPLVLVKVPSGQLAAIKAAQSAQGRSFLFSATVWIENEQTEVAAFR
jgi:hypothetical protein